MQLVNEKFYIWYNRVAVAIGAVFVVGATVGLTVPALSRAIPQRGLIPIIALIGITQIIYGVVFFKRIAGGNTGVGGVVAAMILSIGITSFVHNSGQLHSWFVLLWFVQMLASGMFGLYAIIGSGFMVTMYYVLTTTGVYSRQFVDPIAIGVLTASYLCGGISYLTWKRLYRTQESRQINSLTGQLQGKQQQAEILIQSISDGIIMTDIEGKITLLNPAAAKLTQWPIEEAVGIDVQLVTSFKQDDGKEITPQEQPFQQVLASNQECVKTLQIIGRNDKAAKIVSLVVTPITAGKDARLAGMVAVIRDVSVARAEEHRRADFISTASHEMRTPVAAIEGYLALALNEKVSRIDNKARDFLVKAHESTQHLGKLFQDLLTSAKAEDGRLVSHAVVVEMGVYLEEIVEGLRFAAEKKGMLVDFAVGASDGHEAGGKIIRPLYYTHIDPDRMREVVTNLFDNAVKYSEKGKLTVGLTGNTSVLQFFIRDTGHGIPAEDIPHLFQKFYRVDNSSTRTVGGTGLGLFICRKIVELYQGRIWVESEVNKGSTFYINLPRLSAQKATELQSHEVLQPIL